MPKGIGYPGGRKPPKGKIKPKRGTGRGKRKK
jgi:hypothetical protein